MNKLFTDAAWEDYRSWSDNKHMMRRVNELIKDIDRHPFEGLGKPESLKYNLSGKWSRRIDRQHRIVYQVENSTVVFFSFRDRY